MGAHAQRTPLIWANTYGKGRVFGTTLAHNNKTMQDPVSSTCSPGACSGPATRLDENGVPKPGYNPRSRSNDLTFWVLRTGWR